ncbi:hypothetical protein Rin_00020560, partial [Candidatus Regiella insecticola 5.15]
GGNSAHRLLAVMLLLWGLVSESRAQEILIEAEFRPSLLNRGQDGFQNKTENSGICKVIDCGKEVFSIGLIGNAIQSRDIPADGEDRDSIYIKFPAPPNKPLDIKLKDSETGIAAKTLGKFTITRFGASYRDRFHARIKHNRGYGWGDNVAWINGPPEKSVSPSCIGSQGIGYQQSGTYGAYHFIWEMAPNGICVKKSYYVRPKNNTESLSYYFTGEEALEAPKNNKDRCLPEDPDCVATLQSISFAYALKLPSPLSMASGIYTNEDDVRFSIGNGSTDIDFGDNFRWVGDQNVTLKFKLEVAHDLKVTPEFGAEKVILVPQDGSQRGWDRYLSGGIKPTKLTGRSKFRLSSSGEFTVYLKCDKDFSQQDGECALTSEKDPSNEVPVRAFLTLASNIVVKDSQKSVTRQPLCTKKDLLNNNIFHTNNPAQNYPGHIDFEVSGKKHIETLLTNQPDTYKGNVTVIFDANIHA